MVPFKLTVCGISELGGFAKSGVSHVLSILDPGAIEPPAFFDFDPHHRLELRFHDVIDDSQPQYEPPQLGHIKQLLAFGERMIGEQSATHLLVHCHMGVSRSSASMMLLLAQARPDVPGLEIADQVLNIRPIAWPNSRMITLGDALLGRKGELVDAVYELYRKRAATSPETVQFIREAGRLAELDNI